MSVSSKETIIKIKPVEYYNKTQIKIKLFHKSIISNENLNLYRINTNNFDTAKINYKPISYDSNRLGNYEIEKGLITLLLNKSSSFEGIHSFFLWNRVILDNKFASNCSLLFYDTINQNPEDTYKYILCTEDRVLISESIKFEPLKDSKIEIDSITYKTFDKRIEFKWKYNNKSFFGVNIYRSENKNNFIKLNKNPIVVTRTEDKSGKYKYPSFFYADDSLKYYTKYCYKFTPVDYFGEERSTSKPIEIVIKDTVPPKPPYYLKAKPERKTIKLNWNYTDTSDYDSIKVYRKYYKSEEFELIKKTKFNFNFNGFRDSLNKSGTYYYYVTASDSSGNEAISNTAMAEIIDVKGPPPPNNIKALLDSQNIVTLKWNNLNKCTDLKGYRVYRTVSNEKQEYFVLLNSTIIKDTIFKDTLNKVSKDYFFYRIKSIDTNYNSGEFSKTVKIKLPDKVPPEKPFIKNICQDSNNLIIKWLQNYEKDLSGYIIYLNNKPLNKKTINKNSSSYNFSPTTDGLLVFKMRAIDTAGNLSVFSNSFSYNYDKKNKKIKKNFKCSIKQKKKKIIIKVSSEGPYKGYRVYALSNNQNKQISGLTNSKKKVLPCPAPLPDSLLIKAYFKGKNINKTFILNDN